MNDKTIRFPGRIASATEPDVVTDGPADNTLGLPSFGDNRVGGPAANMIAFPGIGDNRSGGSAYDPGVGDETVQAVSDAAGNIVKLSPEQQKAISCILSGMAFVCIGIKPTDRGASFYRAISGDASDLRNAHPHLAEQIDKAFYAKGLL